MVVAFLKRCRAPNPYSIVSEKIIVSCRITVVTAVLVLVAAMLSLLDGIPIEYGNQRDHFENRRLISGGESAREEDNYGFFVYFEGDGMCGGSLIAPMVVLTAGHCWTAVATKDLIIGPVYATEGSAVRSQNERRIGKVAEYRIHPDYNVGGIINNDFLLIRLSSIERVEITEDTKAKDMGSYGAWRDDGDRRRISNDGNDDKLQYIRINSDPNIPADYSPLNVIGMGMGNVNSLDVAETLQHISTSNERGSFHKIPTSVCNGPRSYDGLIDEETMFCAGTMEGGMDACRGDSGGPLFYYKDYEISDGGVNHVDENSQREPVQVGVVSWGSGCARPLFPSVYARISSAHRWIQDVVCGDWKSRITTGDRSDSDNDEDWHLCQDYDDRHDRNRTGGIFKIDDAIDGNRGDLGCDKTVEVSLEFQLTADAYGWETSWELLSNKDGGDIGSDSPKRIAGDQLFNNHETRFYRFCLAREEHRNDAEEVDHDGNINGGPDIKYSDIGQLVNGEDADNNSDINLLTYGSHCYTLNVHDQMFDGMVHEASHSAVGDEEPAATPSSLSTDPAGFGIRFGTAQTYENFEFPNFGDTATFVLCPTAATDENESKNGESQQKTDRIIVVTDAPSHQPTVAPSVMPSAVPTAPRIPLGELISMDFSGRKAEAAKSFDSGLRGKKARRNDIESTTDRWWGNGRGWLKFGGENP